ncbi:MAG: LytTR family DNA-binding domain-containing protein [Bacteroidales bacterium]|nr:LytTR family DNA-binding domain-containing protein [Bacteroidales bacterium]
MKLKCLIVDDEVLAQDVIEKYISTIPTLKLAGKCDNAVEAISFLHNNYVDLLFLDLNMPELSGLEMLKTLTNPPKVILTTAYSEYALESYEYGVVDYLLKPIKLERFIKSVNKVVEQYNENTVIEDIPEKQHVQSIFIKEDQVTYQIDLNDILFVEAYGNYLKVHTLEKIYVARDTMHDMESKLSDEIFLRIHKSYIVSVLKIESVSGNRVFINNQEIPVGEMYKMALKQTINESRK